VPLSFSGIDDKDENEMVTLESLGGWLIGSLLFAFAAWKIFSKTGQTPALALLAFIPGIGPMIVALIFGRGRWPRFPNR
jgi:hypothetical protein